MATLIVSYHWDLYDAEGKVHANGYCTKLEQIEAQRITISEMIRIPLFSKVTRVDAIDVPDVQENSPDSSIQTAEAVLPHVPQKIIRKKNHRS